MSREAMQMALEALESDPTSLAWLISKKQAITALRTAIEKAEDAVAAEREACAKVCEERQEVFEKYYTKGLAAMCAETIRARSKQ